MYLIFDTLYLILDTQSADSRVPTLPATLNCNYSTSVEGREEQGLGPLYLIVGSQYTVAPACRAEKSEASARIAMTKEATALEPK